MRKLFVFLAFVLGMVGLMAWLMTSTEEIKALDFELDPEDL
jgi:hypothetical protein